MPKIALLSVAHVEGLSSAHLSTRFLPPGAGQPQAGVTTQHFPVREQRLRSALQDALMHVQKHRCGSGRIFAFSNFSKIFTRERYFLTVHQALVTDKSEHKFWALILHPIIPKTTLTRNDTL